MNGRLILVHGALPPGWRDPRDGLFAAFHRTYRMFSEQGVDVISDDDAQT